MPAFAKELMAKRALGSALLCALLGGCPTPAKGPRARVDVPQLVASFDLPRELRSSELSGIAWDPQARRLDAISDHVPHVVPLFPNENFDTWALGEPIGLSVMDPWDGEGIALVAGGFLVANEAGPRLYELDRTGSLLRELTIPDHFLASVPNASFESMSVTEDGRYLFTGNERALRVDGPVPTTSVGTTVRILRIDRRTGQKIEFAYRTDPIFAEGAKGEIGVADMAAISPTDLLVLERAYVPDVGNRICIYRVDLKDAPDVIGLIGLSADTPVLEKALVVDLVEIPGQDRRAGAPPHPLYANYEGMALGPVRPDGRRLLFLVSDDNGHLDQSARLLTLAVAGIR